LGLQRRGYALSLNDSAERRQYNEQTTKMADQYAKEK